MAALTIGCAGFSGNGLAQSGFPAKKPLDWGAKHVPDSLIVKFKDGASASSMRVAHAQHGAVVVNHFKRVRADVLKLPAHANLQAVAEAYSRRPDVEYAEPNYIVHASATPNDTYYSSLWGMANTGQTGGVLDADIDADEAWDSETGSSDVIVGVIDTGIDYNHPDLAANVWTNAVEAGGTTGVDDDGNGVVDDIHGMRAVSGTGIPSSGDPMDDHHHGTHVSGTIGAVGNNGIGVAGVCWNVRLMGLKFMDSSGSGSTADAIACIEYAIDMGTRVTNNSWGGDAYSQALKDAIDAAGAANQLFVAAAGNNGWNNESVAFYPASYSSSNLIAVASSDLNDVRSSFSNYGATSVDLAAPGSSILSSTPGNTYSTFNGTSMATPHVTGAVALLLSNAPSSTAAELKDWILDSVDVLPAWSGLVLTAGRLNVARALSLTVSSEGKVNFRRTAYLCSDTSSIEVRDRDLQGGVTVDVTLESSNSDSEVLTLTESPSYSGVFSGSIFVDGGTVSLNDGVLQVSDGDDITVVYDDADDGDGFAAIVDDDANIDCTPPSIFNVAVTNITGSRARVTFETDEPTTADIHYGTTCGSLLETTSSPVGTSHAVLITGLAPWTTYFFAIEAADIATNVGVYDNNGSCDSFSTVDSSDYYTELFSANDNDLDNSIYTFTPNGSASFYEICRDAATTFPVSTTGATAFSMSDDSYTAVTLLGGVTGSLYGVSYTTLYIGSNGYVTLGSGDLTYDESVSAHFGRARIAALFDDLNPVTGGTISFKQLPDRAVVTYSSIREYGALTTNSFQIELFFNGMIRITYLGIAARDGLVGLSDGLGAPTDFSESDFNAYSICPLTVLSIARASANPSKATLVKFDVSFSNTVAGVDTADFVLATQGVSGATVLGVSGVGAIRSVTVNTGTGNGAIRLDAIDNNTIIGPGSSQLGGPGPGNGDFAAGETYTIDKIKPTVILSSTASSTTAISPIPLTITFSEPVVGFVATDIAATNATVSGFSGSGASYIANLYPLAVGTVTAKINANVASDTAGNLNMGSLTLSRSYDNTFPLVTAINRKTATPTKATTVSFAVTFSKFVTGVDVSDFALTTTGVSGAAVTAVTGSGSSYTVSVSTGTGNGTIRLDLIDSDSIVAATTLAPLGGAGVGNGSFTTGQIYTIDKTRPTVIMSTTAPEPTSVSPIPISIMFSESVNNFVSTDVTVTNATVANFSGLGASYTCELIPIAPGILTAKIVGGVATDAANNTNLASTKLSRTYQP